MSTLEKRQDQDMLKSIVAICIGASCGALLRWWLGTQLNSLFPAIPPGTLVANLVGGYVIGLAIAFFALSPNVPAEWRLLIITGFCGGLTTFSTFSAELVLLLQDGKLAAASAAAAAHLVGSLVMTVAGMATVALLRH
jgi:CrcB protein